MLNTPVVFLVFNRPDTTRRVFAEIRKAKPKKLLIVADGPRPDQPGETELCAEVRAICEQVDWDCEILREYSDVNLGCKLRVSSGINWVFQNCDEAIILEDDCLPDQTFFQYCTELLEYYRTDNRVMLISGDNFLSESEQVYNYSYYYGYCFHVWGWATWKRAWDKYDILMKTWPELSNDESEWLTAILPDELMKNYWKEVFSKSYAGEIDTWDYQWIFSCWSQNGLAVIPNKNLVTNMGFGSDATHTKQKISTLAELQIKNMDFPILHPPFIVRDVRADELTINRICPWVNHHASLMDRLKHMISRYYR